MRNLERYIWMFITAALIIMLLLKTCHKPGTDPSAGVVTILTQTKIDTIPGKSIDRPVPLPYAVRFTDTLVKHDTMTVTKTVEIIKETLDHAHIGYSYYRDTLPMAKKGFMVLKDTVQGLLTGRSYEWSIYDTTTTITKIMREKKRNKLYLGFEYAYPVNYLGAGVMFQFKNDNILKAGYGYANKQPQYSLSYFFKIKLHK